MVAPSNRFTTDRNLVPSSVINVPLQKGATPTAHNRSMSAPRAATTSRRLAIMTDLGKGTDPVGQHSQSRVSNTRSSSVATSHNFPSAATMDTMEMECDYDSSATELYELLESSHWEQARSRCRSHPQETRTWIVRKDKNHQVRWRLLPLHAAIIFQAPSFVVSALLEKYPTAASRKDDQGMLPLHLAFRHKQEDEDLLEILMVQYPKAVLMRDRRDRVPLDHGRESQFSSKLMRLYAQALASAQGTVTNTHKLGKTSSGTIMESHTAQTDSLTHSVAPSSHQLAKMEADHEVKLEAVKSDHDYQMQSLKDNYEERLQRAEEDKHMAVSRIRQEAEEQREALVAQHADEINEMRDLLTRQVNQDRAVNESLQKEVEVLQTALEDAKSQADILTSKYARVSQDNSVLKDFLDMIRQDQIAMQDIATKQQEYLEAARAIRTELVQTLLKQEDNDHQNDRMRGTQLVDIADKVQRSIDDFIMERQLDRSSSAHNPNSNSGRHSSPSRRPTGRTTTTTTTNNNNHSTLLSSSRRHYAHDLPPRHHHHHHHHHPTTTGRGPSRMDMERDHHTNNTTHRHGDVDLEQQHGTTNRLYSDDHGQTEVVPQSSNKNNKNNTTSNHPTSTRVPSSSTNNYSSSNNRFTTTTGGSKQQSSGRYRHPSLVDSSSNDYGEVHVLGDEISAITENSAY